MPENSPKLIEHKEYSGGILPATFELSIPGAYLKVDFFEDDRNNYDPHAVRVRDIRIPEQERGHGLGQALQKALLVECSKRNISTIFGSTQNPNVLLSWLKIPEVKGKLFLMVAGKKIDFDAKTLEEVLRQEIQKNNIKNTDTQPRGTHFLDYVIEL